MTTLALTQKQHRLISTAASLEGVKIQAFIRNAAVESAHLVVLAHLQDDQAFDAFERALDQKKHPRQVHLSIVRPHPGGEP